MSFTITLRGIIVSAFWASGIAVGLLDITYGPPLVALSIGLMLAGATVSVLGRIDRYAASWETAYEAGCEVTKLRRTR